MRVLAFDTATAIAGMAILEDGELLCEQGSTVRASHGEALLPELSALLARAGLSLSSIDLFAVGLGPGSFTGTRIGVATAKGLAWAEQKPLVGVSTLRVLARGLGDHGEGARLVLTDAYKGEVYAALYRRGLGATLEDGIMPFHAPPEEALSRLLPALAQDASFAICGGGFARYAQLFAPLLERGGRPAPAEADLPRGECLAREALEAFAREGASQLSSLEPLYLRPSDAQLPSR